MWTPLFVLGGRDMVDKVFQMIKDKMKLRETGRLDVPGQRVDLLKKRIELIEGGFRLSGKRWLVDSIVQRFGVEQSKYVGTPIVQYSSRQITDAVPLTGQAISEYRMHVGVLMHLAHDRPDLQYSVKEAARHMQCCDLMQVVGKRGAEDVLNICRLCSWTASAICSGRCSWDARCRAQGDDRGASQAVVWTLASTGFAWWSDAENHCKGAHPLRRFLFFTTGRGR
jgi:hypothetical protein